MNGKLKPNSFNMWNSSLHEKIENNIRKNTSHIIMLKLLRHGHGHVEVT